TEQGTYTITWNFDDGNGNDIDVDQTVIIEDVTNPTISCVSDFETTLAEGETNYTVSGTEFDPISADDNCGSVGIENDYNTTETLDSAEFAIGTTTVVWTVMDDAGNTATCSFDVVVNAYVGLADMNNQISVYPNPTNGQFTIYNGQFTINNIEITDVTGKVIYSDNKVEKSAKHQINELMNYSNGIYFLKITSEEGTYTEKIIKQ
ncbi:MAG: T9SS type A sorting domain-containing protein, partial [Bacteroidales bacterium]|nr:T9SS type A sorting domain-containing protein [Bacteroidales bacterium]